MEQAALLGISEGAPGISFYLRADLALTVSRRAGPLWQLLAVFVTGLPTEEAVAALRLCRAARGTGRRACKDSPPPVRARARGLPQALVGAEVSGSAPAQPPWGRALMRMNSQEIEISGSSGLVRVPTLVIHRRPETTVSVEGGRDVARIFSCARLMEFPHRPTFLRW